MALFIRLFMVLISFSSPFQIKLVKSMTGLTRPYKVLNPNSRSSRSSLLPDRTFYLSNLNQYIKHEQIFHLLISPWAVQLDFWTSDVLRLLSVVSYCSEYSITRDELQSNLHALKPLVLANNYTFYPSPKLFNITVSNYVVVLCSKNAL